MAHGESGGESDGERGVSSVPLAERSVRTQRRALGALSLAAAGVVFAALWTVLGPSVTVVLATIGSAGAVFAGGVLLACRVYGHAVECGARPFCECERCGRPMDDR